MRLPDSTGGPLLISGGVVVDVEAGRAREADVLVEAGRITGVGEFTDSPAVRRLSAEGLWLIPGLIDCHVHLVGSNVGREPFGRYLERSPEVRALRIAAHAAAFLAAGVTTVRHLGHGDPQHIREVQGVIDDGTILAPWLLSCGWAVSQTGGHGDLPQWPIPLLEQIQPSAAFCDGEEQLRSFVQEQHKLGASWIKLFATQGTISTSEDRANLPNFNSGELAAVVGEAHARGMRVAAHATGREGALRALRAGVDTLEHGPAVMDAEFLETAIESGATVVPTLSVTAWAATNGSAHGLPEWATARSQQRLAGQMETVRLLHERGVPVAVGSDSGTLPRLMGTNEEVRNLAAAGFTPAEIVRMATVNAARALGRGDDIGSIETGKRADIVAVTANPLDDPRVLADAGIVSFVVRAGEAAPAKRLGSSQVVYRATPVRQPQLVKRITGDSPLIIRGGTVVDSSGTRVGHDILIHSIHIAEVAADIESDARELDASGMKVLPGLVHPWFDPGSSNTLALAKKLFDLLLGGVTTVHMPGVAIERGLALRQATSEGLTPGPRLVLSDSAGEASTPDALLADLRRSLGFGADLVLVDELNEADRSIAGLVASDLKRHVTTKANLRRSCDNARFRESLGAAAQAGLSIEELIRASSLEPAGALGLQDSVGSIESGKLADLVIVETDTGQPVAIVSAESSIR